MKYLFSDLDGTLMLDENNKTTGITIPMKNKQAIEKFESLGHKFAIATGRPYLATMNINYSNNLKDFSICENGMIASINNKIIFEDNLNQNDLKIVFEFCLENKIEFIGFYKNENISFYNESACNSATNLRIEKYKDKFSFINFKDIDISKVIHLTILFSSSNNQDKIIKELSSSLKYSNLIHTMNDAADLVNYNTNKLTTIKKIMEKLNISFEKVAYVGDGLNDLECLNYFKYSYVMNNATNILKSNLNNNNIEFVNSVSEAIDLFMKENNEHKKC